MTRSPGRSKPCARSWRISLAQTLAANCFRRIGHFNKLTVAVAGDILSAMPFLLVLALAVRAAAAPAFAAPPEQARARLEAATVALSSGDYVGALTRIEEALSRDGETAALYQLRSAARSGLNRHDEALIDAQKALSINPDSAAGLLRRAQAREALGREPSHALDDYRLAAQIDKSLAPVYAQANSRLAPPVKRPRRWGAAGAVGAVLASLIALMATLGRRKKARHVRFASVLKMAPASLEPRPGQVVGGRYILGCLLERRAGELIYEARDLEDRPKVVRRYATGPEGRAPEHGGGSRGLGPQAPRHPRPGNHIFRRSGRLCRL